MKFAGTFCASLSAFHFTTPATSSPTLTFFLPQQISYLQFHARHRRINYISRRLVSNNGPREEIRRSAQRYRKVQQRPAIEYVVSSKGYVQLQGRIAEWYIFYLSLCHWLIRVSGNPSFRTDSAISGNRNQGERVLQKWVPDGPVATEGGLESASKSKGGAWDQFAENERRFGLTTDYDENIYTTAIDKSHPMYKQRLAEADKKAKEIERSVTNNAHVAEERITDNLTGDGGDEEDK